MRSWREASNVSKQRQCFRPTIITFPYLMPKLMKHCMILYTISIFPHCPVICERENLCPALVALPVLGKRNQGRSDEYYAHSALH